VVPDRFGRDSEPVHDLLVRHPAAQRSLGQARTVSTSLIGIAAKRNGNAKP
jgi:hypothetical protein